MRIGLATLHHGRPEHLARQGAAVAQLLGLHRYLVVAMDDVPLPAGAERLEFGPVNPDRLPLAAARNAAVTAMEDCDLVILLDVDCIPDPGLLDAYRAGFAAVTADRSILMGPVGWLAATPAGDLPAADRRDARLRVKRVFPAEGMAPEPRIELFWSLSFALSPAVHAAVGGFDEGFDGWGAEDTDYGRRAQAAGVELWKVAGAWAYHQPHPPMRQTPGQIAALLHNARRFHRRWGDWPMPDVLDDLARSGQIAWGPAGPRIVSSEVADRTNVGAR